jgi:hypothetical protein
MRKVTESNEMGDKNSNAKGVSPHLIKKPLPVKIVEAIGWVYVALAVLSLLPMSKVMRLESSLYISSLPIAMLIGMVVALRRGRRTLFLLGNTVVMLLILLGLIAYSRVSANVYTIVGCIVCSMFLVAPFVLLYLPVSNRWYFELGDFGLSIRSIAVFVAVCLVVGFLVGLPEMGCCRMMAYRSKSHELSMLGRSLLACMAENSLDRETGRPWVDPAGFTNSAQFVQALIEAHDDVKNAIGRYTNIWCIAVNSPADDYFPVVFTDNVDPRELLYRGERHWNVTLTCPKERGGSCFDFCKKIVVLIRSNGDALRLERKLLRRNYIFRNGMPTPNPDTYFLTPTGRVDLVEEQLGTGPAEPL